MHDRMFIVITVSCGVDCVTYLKAHMDWSYYDLMETVCIIRTTRGDRALALAYWCIGLLRYISLYMYDGMIEYGIIFVVIYRYEIFTC